MAAFAHSASATATVVTETLPAELVVPIVLPEKSIVVDGWVVIPRGAVGEGEIISAECARASRYDRRPA